MNELFLYFLPFKLKSIRDLNVWKKNTEYMCIPFIYQSFWRTILSLNNCWWSFVAWKPTQECKIVDTKVYRTIVLFLDLDSVWIFFLGYDLMWEKDCMISELDDFIYLIWDEIKVHPSLLHIRIKARSWSSSWFPC